MPREVQTSNIGVDELTNELRHISNIIPNHINIDAKSVEQGLGKLVLTLIEFIRRLLEAQAVRRMDANDLTPAQLEELGLALMKLEERMQYLKKEFGLADEDLNLNLGRCGFCISGLAPI